jgi:hypothetical protein
MSERKVRSIRQDRQERDGLFSFNCVTVLISKEKKGGT